MKNLGLIGHLDRPNVGAATRSIIEWCEQNGITIRISAELGSLIGRSDIASETGEIGRSSDIIISLGGDGSMLSSARASGVHSIPVLGINLGNLGFLTEVPENKIDDSLDRLKAGKYRIEERMVLDVRIGSDGEEGIFALNDIVIYHGESAKLIELHLFANDEFVSSYSGDGIIISTPTGSTAYSLSVGGPIISPRMEAIEVSPISPHTLTLRPIIFPADDILTVKVAEKSDQPRVSVDGRVAGNLEKGRKVRIKKAAHKMKLVRFGEKSFYSALRKKLHWGKRPLMKN